MPSASCFSRDYNQGIFGIQALEIITYQIQIQVPLGAPSVLQLGLLTSQGFRPGVPGVL